MKKISRKIKNILPRNIIYCDVGARWGINEPWKQFENNLDLISFEPDEEEFAKLEKSKNINDRVYNHALYKEPGKINLNLTKARGCSSLYIPNQSFLENYPEPERFQIEKKIEVDATTLDVLNSNGKLTELDFIKIDVQGAELDILNGGESFLSQNILGIEVEVEFHSMYKKQALFSDVDIYIRNKLNLELQDIRKAYWKYPQGVNIGGNKGQLIFGDALYFRSPDKVIEMCNSLDADEARNKLQIACSIGIVYGYLDYSLNLLSRLKNNEIIDKKTISIWEKMIVSYGRSIKYNLKGANIFSAVFRLLSSACQPTYNGWASGGETHLGNRKKGCIFN